jgi:hypothetical protein
MSDLRYTIRSLLRAPWFTIAAVLTFAVGIGLNVAVFSIVDRMLFRELPYGDLDRLVLLRSCNERGSCGSSFPAVLAFEGQRRLTTVDDIAVAAMTLPYRVSFRRRGSAAAPDQCFAEPASGAGRAPDHGT